MANLSSSESHDSSSEPMVDPSSQSSNSSIDSSNSSSESSESSSESSESSSESSESSSESSESSSESSSSESSSSESSSSESSSSESSDSSSKSSDSSSKLSDSDDLRHQQHWHQGDRVVQGFKQLISKYSRNAIIDYRPQQSINANISTVSVDDHVNSKQFLLDRLQSSLLPLLHHQINVLSLALNPSEITDEPGSKLQLISEIQSELERITDQIQHIITSVYPESLCTPHRADDQHLGSLKSYRLCHLKRAFQSYGGGFLGTLCLISRWAYRLIHEIQLSSKKLSRRSSCGVSRDSLDEYIPCALRSIGSAIMILRGSELDVAQNLWPAKLRSMDTIWEMPISIPGINGLRRIRSVSREPALKLAKLSIPIKKLCKIFFLKISRRGINLKALPYSTKMSSVQIESLAGSIVIVKDELHKFHSQLSSGYEEHVDTSRSQLLKMAATLKTHLDTPMVLILSHFVHTTDFPDKEYYHSWFCAWHGLYQLAIHNFTNFTNQAFK
ncbi:hypothetical protein PtB15_1B501 [Puccinia triticina]|nr:hypothetical protein PtB15_1B501 [Puccinia triticina]